MLNIGYTATLSVSYTMRSVAAYRCENTLTANTCNMYDCTRVSYNMEVEP